MSDSYISLSKFELGQTYEILVSEALTVINEAITIAELTPRLFPERSREVTGSVPFNFLTGSANPSRFTCAQGSAGEP